MSKEAEIVDRVLSCRQVADRLGIHPRTLTRMEARGEAPARIQVTQKIVGYRTSELERFLASRTIT